MLSVEGLAPPTVTCERCGAFVPRVSALGAQKLCDGCITRIATTVRFWPAGYIKGVGGLLNPALAAVLLCLNYSRLGHRTAARKYAIHAALLIGFYSLVMLSILKIPNMFLWPGAITYSVIAGNDWQPSWQLLKAQGVTRANVWLPPIITLVGLFSVLIGLSLLGVIQ